MERLTIDELIAHCDRQLERLPSGSIMYQEHESVRAYLQILRHYMKTGTVEEFRALKEAELSCQKCRDSGLSKVCEDKHAGYVCPNKAALGGKERD